MQLVAHEGKAILRSSLVAIFSKRLAAVLTILLYASTSAGSIRVAAKDSLATSKADFVCDGVDDQIEINQAIASLPAGGGKVELLEGVYLLTDSVEITASHTTLSGAGSATVLKHAPSQWIKLTADGKKGEKVISVEDTSQLHLGHLIGISDYLPPESDSQTYHYYRHYYVPSEFYLVKELTTRTITLDRGLDVSVSTANNARMAPAWAMVKAYGKTNLELKDFTVDCNRDNVARIFGSGKYSHHPGPEPVKPDGYTCPFPQLLSKVRHAEELTSAIYMDSAHHSRFTNLTLHDIPMSGIFLIESHYVLVQGNTIRDFGLKGYVNCFGDHARIIGNLIENSMHEYGIIIYAPSSEYAVVSNNIVRNTRGSAICINAARAVTITGNIVYGGHAGISVVSRQAAVSGNLVENSSPGIYIHDLPGFGAVSVTITGNSLRDCGAAFEAHNATQVNIANNTIAGTKGVPALKASATVDNFTIANNQFLSDTPYEGPALVIGGKNNRIIGNRFGGFKQGIHFQPTAAKNRAENNDFLTLPQGIHDEGKDNIWPR